MKLKNFSFCVSSLSPYTPPEAKRLLGAGIVEGHHSIKDGSSITTSSIVKIVEVEGANFLHTASGSIYELGEIDPLYAQLYPDAFSKIKEKFKEQ